MQDVNNDMDDLFRKAAEHYPLQTGVADWEKVLAGLKEDDDVPMPVAIDAGQKRKRRALWLLWLLPLCLLYIPLHDHYLTKNEVVKTKTLVKKDDTAAATNNTIKTAPQSSDNASDNSISLAANNTNSSAISHPHSAQRFDANGNKMLDNTSVVLAKNIRNKKQEAAIAIPGYNKAKTDEETANNNSSNADDKGEAALKNNILNKQPDEASQRIEKIATEENNTTTGLHKNDTATVASVANEKDSSLVKAREEQKNKNKTAKQQTQWQKGFYGGLLGSFDISTVKLQRINKTGYGLQILAGYRISKHISIETGLGWQLKNYYSTGKYFDKKKAHIADAVEIYFSNGNCKMLEIPLSVKYDFAINRKSSWFATAGLSSYFMKKENYFYHGNYRSNNMSWIYDTTRYYNNSGNNLLSVASFSIGYQLQLNKHSTLRIEPYVKLPLHGIGIANIPITSTGISVGFTRKF